MIKLDKEKYYRIMEKEGASSAITALHKEFQNIEFETFEGERGYQPELWKDLEEVRAFSRELWDRNTSPSGPAKKLFPDAGVLGK